ncbi:MAG: ATP-binding protein [Syntrophaceae bacterium]
MIKNKLFIKIYLGFLVTTIVTIATMTFLDRLTGSGPMIDRLRHHIDKSLSFYSQEAVRIFEGDGPRPLIEYLDRIERFSGVKPFLFDSQGTEVTGRTPPAEIKDFALSAGGGPEGKPKLSDDMLFAARKADGTKGAYIFAVKLPKPSPGFRPPGPPPLGPPPGPLALLGPPGPPPDWMPLSFLIRLALGLTISGVFCYIFARYMTAPVLKLGNAVRQFARGDLAIRVGAKLGGREDEISLLARDFDNMAERIESLLNSQRNLLRDVSHELRSPLARLNVALELCRKSASPDSDKYLDRISREADRLNEMIGQILAYNKMESRASGLKIEKLDLEELIREIAADAEYEAKSRNRQISLKTEPCVIEGDREILRRALENVIRNAVSYTAEHSAVEIAQERRSEKDKNSAVISVRDHGAGVPEKDLANIFRPFYRADEGRGSETGGTGLGLAITESAIRMHNGAVRAENTPDGGMIVEITLPGIPAGRGVQQPAE